MRVHVFIFVAFLCISTTCFAFPEMQAEVTEINWGKIYSGEKKEHTFILRNKGDSPLIITEVRSSCGCTAAMISDKKILPYKQAELRIRFNSKYFLGPIVKRVLVTSNDPRQPQRQFILQANVIQELEVTPLHLVLENFPANKEIVRNLSLTNHSDLSIHIKSVRSTSRYIVPSKVQTTLESGETTNITLTIHPQQSQKVNSNSYILIDAHGHTRNQIRVRITTKIVKEQP